MPRLLLPVFVILLVVLGCLPARPTSPEAECWQTFMARQEAEGFSGAVLVAEGDEVLFQREYGAAANDGQVTAFWVASISKTITATAVLKLVEEGKVDLAAPLATYLPRVPATLAGVTVDQLLAHRSGLPQAYRADGVAEREAATDSLVQQAPVRKPGEFGYSNDGYNLLAILIETVAGESYEDYVRRQVFVPAGMTGAGFWGREAEPSTVAPPQKAREAAWQPKTIWRKGRSVANWGYRGASGIYATPEDLFRFARALATGRLLAKPTVALMLAAKGPAPVLTGQTYGYGWWLQLREGQAESYWHGGNEDWLGHNGMVKVKRARTYVVLTNGGAVQKESWSRRVEAGLLACEQAGGGGAK